MCVSLSLRILGLIYKKGGSLGSRCWGPWVWQGKRRKDVNATTAEGAVLTS